MKNWKRLSEKFEQKLYLKVVHLGLLDYIVSQKIMVPTFVNKNMLFCVASHDDSFKKKWGPKPWDSRDISKILRVQFILGHPLYSSLKNLHRKSGENICSDAFLYKSELFIYVYLTNIRKNILECTRGTENKLQQERKYRNKQRERTHIIQKIKKSSNCNLCKAQNVYIRFPSPKG